jgi:putative acyl-CoA dehydrogenase
MSFFQDPPQNPNLYEVDKALKTELTRRLPKETLDAWTPRLESLGEHTATTLARLAERAESELPEHVPYDSFGKRIDDIRVSPAWHKLKDFSAEHGVVATGYDESLGDRCRVMQTAVIHLFSASSATFSCPLAMTDAAARVLIDQAPDALRDRLVPQLLSKDPKAFITSGQWMTERTGGSDVGGTETIARHTGEHVEGETYALHGTKWFTSSTTSEMALTLARVEDESGETVAGSRGLTMFAVDVKRTGEGEGLEGIQVNRLKDKLGTRGLPTAELTLDGVRAVRIGDIGRGVPGIATMLNITRYYNACASVSGMARATFLARDYAKRRSAFGRPIAEQPLHKRTLDEMEAETAAALALTFEVADLLGKMEHGTISEDDQRRLRGLIPIAKLTLGKQAVVVASEALEAFGGAGYVEDTGLPRLLRDAQVLPIWEGTTNVLSLDLLRAEAKEQALSQLLKDLGARMAELPDSLDGDAVGHLRATFGRLTERLAELSKEGDLGAMEFEARRVALTTGYLAEAVFMGESAAHAHASDDEAAARFATFVMKRLAPPMA